MSHRFKSLLNTGAKILAGLLAVVVFVVVAGLVFLETDTGKNILKNKLLSTVNASLAGRVRVGRLAGNLVGSLDLEDVAVEDARGNVAVRVPHVRVDYDLWRLIDTELRIDSIHLDRPVVTARVYPDNTFNLATIPGPEPEQKQPPSTFQISIAQATIADGVGVYLNEAGLGQGVKQAQKKAIQAWLTSLQTSDKSTARRQQNIIDALGEESSSPPNTAVLAGLEATGSFYVYGHSTLRVTLANLETTVHSASLGQPKALTVDALAYQSSPAHLETTVQNLALGHAAALDSLGAAIDFRVQTDRLGNRVAIGPQKLDVQLDQLHAEPDFVGRLAPGVPLTGAVTASAAVAGRPTDLAYRIRAGCRRTPAATVAGTANFPDQTFDNASYDVAALLDALKPSRCIDTAETQVTLQGALAVQGGGFTPGKITASARVALRDSSVAGTDITAAYLAASAADGRVLVEQLDALAPAGRARIHGYVDLGGNYQVDLRADANPKVRRLLARLGGPKMTSEYGRLRLFSRGALDLSAASPLGYVDHAQVLLDGKLEGVTIGDFSVQSGQTHLETLIKSDVQRDHARQITTKARLEAHRLHTPVFSADYLYANGHDRAIVDVPIHNFLTSLAQLTSQWHIKTRRLSAPDTHVDRGDVRVQLDRDRPGGPIRWDVDGSLRGARVRDNRVDRARADLDGQVELDAVEGGVKLGDLAARGSVAAEGVATDAAHIGKATVDLDVGGRLANLHGQVDLDATEVQAAGQSFETVGAEVQLDDTHHFEIHADARPANTREPLELDSSGTITEQFKHVSFDNFAVTTPEGQLSMPTGAAIDLGGGGVRFDQVQLDLGEDRHLSVQGSFRPTGRQDLHVALDEVSIGRLVEQFGLQKLAPPLKAVVGGTVDLAGTAEAPRIDVDMSIHDIYYQDYGPFSVDLRANYADRRLTIASLTARGYETALLDASGEVPVALELPASVRVPRGERVDLDVDIPRFDLARLSEPMPILAQNNAHGLVSAHISLGGTLRDPDIEATAELKDIEFAGELGGQQVKFDQLSSSLQAKYTPPMGKSGGLDGHVGLTWRDQQIVRADVSTPLPIADWIRQNLDKDGQSPPLADSLAQAPLDLSARITGLTLGDVPIESLADADAEGAIEVAVDATGTFANPDANLELTVDDFGWEQYRHINAATTMDLQNQRLAIDQMRLEWDGDEILTAQGAIPLPFETLLGDKPLADLSVNLAAQLTKVPIEKLSAIDYAFAKYEGTLAGYVRLGGSLSDLAFRGRAGLFNTALSDGRPGSVAVRFDGAHGRVQAQAVVCRSDHKILRATAAAPINTNVVAIAGGADITQDGPIHAQLTSDQLHVATLLPKEVATTYVADPEGVLDMDVEIDGTFDKPSVVGHLKLDHGAVTVPFFGRRFTKINLDVKADRDAVDIRTLQVAEDETWVRATGEVGLDGLAPSVIDATIKSHAFNFGGFVDGFDAYVTAKVDVDGDWAADKRTIEAHASNVDITIPEGSGDDLYPTDMNGEVIVLKRQSDANQLVDLDQLLANSDGDDQQASHIELHLTAERDTWIHHSLGDVAVAADITVNLNDGRLSMLGAVDTVRGSVEVLGKQFDVPDQTNAVRFTGASPPNPALQLKAIHPLSRELTDDLGEASDGEPRIIVTVRGRADDPKLDLQADPALSETEVIYVLMTGRAPNQASAGEESRVSGVALGAASGVFASLLQDRLSGALPIDVVRIKPGEEGIRDLRVQVGKYITQDIFVSYVLKLGAEEGEGMNVIKVDYRFLRSWKAELQTSNQLTGEFNLFWDVY